MTEEQSAFVRITNLAECLHEKGHPQTSLKITQELLSLCEKGKLEAQKKFPGKDEESMKARQLYLASYLASNYKEAFGHYEALLKS